MDHRQWQREVSMWTLDLQAWAAEHQQALEELSAVVKLIEEHQTASSTHQNAIARFAGAIEGHEQKLAESYEKHQDADAEATSDASGHVQQKETAARLREAHERMKKHHHIAMAHVMSLRAALEAAM